jgi:hypothetical protein
MAERKQYTQEELIEIGQKVIADRQKRQEQAKEVRRIKNSLYKMYKDGKLGDIKV